MSPEEVAYYERRAEAEIALAQQAQHARVVRAHYELASAYLDRIHGDIPKAGPNLLTA
jgi:hypothetical protein